MEILYRHGRATAAEVRAAMSQPPGYSSVRKQLEILAGKGHVRYEREGRRYVYSPTVPQKEAAEGALQRVVRSFFRGDVDAAMVSLLSQSERPPSEARLRELLRRAEQAEAD